MLKQELEQTRSQPGADAEAKTKPVPRPQPEELGSSASSPKAVAPRPVLRPRYTAEDFKTVANKIRYDLTAAQAKLTDLMNMLATLELPTEDRVFSESRAMTLVRNTAHEYTDSSLADELALMGADRGFIDRALLVAAEVRREASA